MKLHLGCGRQYLDGYVNIDFPPEEHTVQSDLIADKYEDIVKLAYPISSIDEIRLHHVFEHFTRPVALALVCRWRNWLKPGGLLRIETPDALSSFKLMTSPLYSYDQKQQVMRHIFGSHEASWAAHYDGWYKQKFAVTLTALGFERLKFQKKRWGMLRNLEVTGYRAERTFSYDQCVAAVRLLLQQSTVRVKTKDKKSPEGSELEMLEVWMRIWDEAYRA